MASAAKPINAARKTATSNTACPRWAVRCSGIFWLAVRRDCGHNNFFILLARRWRPNLDEGSFRTLQQGARPGEEVQLFDRLTQLNADRQPLWLKWYVSHGLQGMAR